MKRNDIIKLIYDKFNPLGCVELRRDLDRVELQPDELPRIIINDGRATPSESSGFLWDNGGFRRWNMQINIVCAAFDDDEAIGLAASCARLIGEIEAENTSSEEIGDMIPHCVHGEMLAIDISEHDIAVVQAEPRVVLAGLTASVDYVAGRWEL